MRLKSRYVLVLSKIYSKQIELCYIAGILPWPYCKNFFCHSGNTMTLILSERCYLNRTRLKF